MVGEVSELLADEGDKASVLHYLDAAILNVNAWSGAEMRECLNAARTAALQIELDGRSMYVCVVVVGPGDIPWHPVSCRVCGEGAVAAHKHSLLCYFRV